MKVGILQLVALAAVLLVAAGVDAAPGADGAARARMRAELHRLHGVRQSRRAEVLSIPGVVGIGTEARGEPERACITVYVLRETADLRAEIESRLGDVPHEIIERPGGFRAYGTVPPVPAAP
jgi:hypothetical protein